MYETYANTEGKLMARLTEFHRQQGRARVWAKILLTRRPGVEGEGPHLPL
jgi:hypothetical protein